MIQPRSGALLVRPGLEALRDLAAAGQIQAALVNAPDRLSRKYAYQVLLAEELARCGVALVFLQAPSGATPEDQLLGQFQGMIAEYERAQIAERCRRGKRHRAHQGAVNVLSGAPYGYRYVRKTEASAAYCEALELPGRAARSRGRTSTGKFQSIHGILSGTFCHLTQVAIPARLHFGDKHDFKALHIDSSAEKIAGVGPGFQNGGGGRGAESESGSHVGANGIDHAFLVLPAASDNMSAAS